MKVTVKCDVYSFGIVELEVLMGRHPHEVLLHLQSEGSDVHLADVLDNRLAPPAGPVVQDLVLAVSLAMKCLVENPSSRPTMHQVSSKLSADASRPLSAPFHMITLQNLEDMF
ncbi:putative Receptor protein kinase [Quillaja saponaria]|uniref:non-specific serine/threonine protein kinase n=1 Tax=Quillaja saponaria TaxID=32244 RepID=A0AAD7VEF7_QUISA|nr:putative Receptor protein kinase [Quillaja saponaria]